MGWPWGWFPWTRGWDFMNEALSCEMVELFRNVDSKFVGAVVGSKGIVQIFVAIMNMKQTTLY